jgi:hypothetical protein
MAKKSMHSAEQVAAFLEELSTQTDRGAAIIAAAVLDEVLELLLIARFIELSGERRDALFNKIGAPLSSFSAKIEIAHAVGVLGNDGRLALHLVRDIRNAFAHRVEQITFDHPDVASKLSARIQPNLKKMGRSNRQNFLDTFSAVALILYGTLAIDIRLTSVGKTHTQHFLNLLAMAAETAKTKAPPKPEGT